MSYLHLHDILHRDLKPDNILLDSFLFPKIADFGLSKINNSNCLGQSAVSIKGTPRYISPEIWKNYEYSKAYYVYAFAIILYEIITNDVPFKNLQYFSLFLSVCQGYRPEFNRPIPQAYRDLIEACWSQTPSNRPMFDQI